MVTAVPVAPVAVGGMIMTTVWKLLEELALLGKAMLAGAVTLLPVTALLLPEAVAVLAEQGKQGQTPTT